MSEPIEYLTRDSCALCQRAHPAVARWADRVGLPLRVLDVDRDPDLLEVYGDRVPVVRTAEGRVLAEGSIREGSLLVALVLERLRRLLG